MAQGQKRVIDMRKMNGTLRTLSGLSAVLGVLWSCSLENEPTPPFTAPPSGGNGAIVGGSGGGGSSAPVGGNNPSPQSGDEAGAGGSADPGPGNTGEGGDNTGPGPGTPDCDTVTTQATAILTRNCGSCHGPGTNVAGFDYVLDPAELEASGKIKPGDAQGSPLYRRMAAKEMPPASAAQKPSDADIGVIYDWIEACIEPPRPEPEDCGDPYIDTETMVQWMNQDISRVELRDRRFIRYFSLVHTHNVGTCQDELDIYRFAMAKAVNALSLGTQIVAPEAIDPYNTVFRIDLRDYEWEAAGARDDKWEILVDNNPYAFELEDDESEILRDFTQTAIPFQSADWFVNVATRAPLYHDMLDIPANLGELEALLDVDISENIQNLEVDRSGFLNSGVSVRNRVIERHQLPTSSSQSLWIAYDFANDGGRDNIFSNPLDFQFDGAEILWSLPNGLHAYMIINDAGQRLNAAPNNIVVDPRQPDNTVTNGISCMSCHDEGMIDQQDEIRDHVADSNEFNAQERELVADLHPEANDFTSIVNRDGRQFQSALAAMDPPASVRVEPIIEIFDRFEENVDLEQAAAELGIQPSTLLRELGSLDPALSPLATGSVKRETFRDLFAETVCILNLGLADDPECN